MFDAVRQSLLEDIDGVACSYVVHVHTKTTKSIVFIMDLFIVHTQHNIPAPLSVLVSYASFLSAIK